MDQSRFVCITGSWSFLGISIAKMLLARGYSVRFTVPLRADEAGSLMDCEEKASGKLELGEADLLDYGSVFYKINGCSGVFHVPAPCDLIGVQEYPSDTIEYEIQSALNVVEACAASESVKRLVFTSSVSAIVCGSGHGNVGGEQILDERCWTNPEFCRQNKLWSPLTKTLSEQAVWALSNDRGLNLVVVNVASVVGQQISNHNESDLLNQLKGSVALQQNGVCAYVEVEEASLAHVAAFEYEDARGRYICLERMLTEDEKEFLWSSYKTSKDGFEEWIRPLNISNQKFLKLKRQYSGELA